MIETTLRNDLKSAMRAKDQVLLLTLRSLLSALQNEKVAKRTSRDEELPEADEQAILQRELKKRQEAVQIYRDAGNTEAAEAEAAEAQIIEGYLPEPLSDEELQTLVKEAKSEVGSENFGLLMKTAIGKTEGRADGKRVKAMIEKTA